jgi:hypothetical protein
MNITRLTKDHKRKLKKKKKKKSKKEERAIERLKREPETIG